MTMHCAESCRREKADFGKQAISVRHGWEQDGISRCQWEVKLVKWTEEAHEPVEFFGNPGQMSMLSRHFRQ